MKKMFTLCSLLWMAVAGAQPVNYAAKVNPFIGTGGHGHTYPGASVPFGMMQLSPDTRLDGWDGCSGYHYSDSLIYGFSHTHLSGTGIADYCDVLLMPFSGDVKWSNKEYASPFSHKNEQATPGYYEVLLDKHRIKAALTTSIRSGMHQYQFPAGETAGKILLDLQHRDQVLESSLEMVNDYEVKGMRRSKSWASNQVIYFYIKFEQRIKNFGLAANDTLLPMRVTSVHGKNLKAFFDFDIAKHLQVQLKIGISGVSEANAKQNLDAEIKDWDFASVKKAAETAWNKELSKIEVKGGSPDEQSIFYTALYHASLSPNIYTDVNGQYRGTDKQVHTAEGFTNYTVFSLWDTYRALHPLMNIINKKRSANWINTFLAQHKHGGMLPVWELSANETFCMIGYHSIPVMADAVKNGINGFDKNYALSAMMAYAESDRFGLGAYQSKGFISNNDDHESASKTMEYAYDDWCIAQFAKSIGNDAVYKKYLQRSLYYRNLFDPSTGHIRGKVQGFWYAPFKAGEINNFFTEGNSWHYSFAAPHDVSGLIKLYGGKQQFAAKAYDLFYTKEPMSGRDQADVTGLIGQYAQGNEPSHHMAYLFNYAGQPWHTQALVSRINKAFYRNSPDGLIGNEDCGQMSAWYIFSAMGFYPVTPGSGLYALGTPVFDEVKMHLENGRTFSISARNLSAKNFYVKNMLLNGRQYGKTYISNVDFENGGSMVFEMDGKPNYRRGINAVDMPMAITSDESFVAAPYFEMITNKIKDSLLVVLKNIDADAAIYYSIEQGEEAAAFQRYTKPFVLRNAAVVKFYAARKQFKSMVNSQQFYKVVTDRTIIINAEVHPMYTAGGPDALIDGITGTANWKTGEWQSYFDKDFEAVIDFKKPRTFSYVGMHVLQDVSPWIIFPKEVQWEVSSDGKNFTPILSIKNSMDASKDAVEVQELGGAVNASGRYIKVKAINGGKLPAWHESAGQPSHLFVDELIIK